MATLFATRDSTASSPIEVPVSLLGLRADRADISFENITPDIVRVDVRVTNDGTLPSPGTAMHLESAPLGAFLPWQSLVTLTVPALMPRQSLVVSGTAWIPRPLALAKGKVEKITPSQFVETVLAPVEPEPAPRPTTAKTPKAARRPPITANDPMALLGRAGFHWAGNINILMRNKAVERHVAKALRVYPGKTNGAMFFVGDRKDGYRFDLTGMADEWQAELLNVTDRPSLRPNGARGVEQSKWIELRGASIFYLLLRPPQAAEFGTVQVHIQRQSDNLEAVVEFNLDSHAAGAGCYTV